MILRFLLGLTPTWAIWSNGNRVENGLVMSTKKTCNTSETEAEHLGDEHHLIIHQFIIWNQNGGCCTT